MFNPKQLINFNYEMAFIPCSDKQALDLLMKQVGCYFQHPYPKDIELLFAIYP